MLWNSLMVLPPLLLGLFTLYDPAFEQDTNDVPHMTVVLLVGVTAFAIIFAINSSIHSYLVLRYAEGDKVSQSVLSRHQKILYIQI